MTSHLTEPATTTAEVTTPARAPSPAGLAHLPVSVFATVMGIGGAALAWQRGAATLDLSPVPGHVLAGTALVVFAAAGVAYTFPLAALTSAFLAASGPGATGYRAAAVLALIVVSLLVAALTVRTLVALRRRELCRPEPPTPPRSDAEQGTAP